MSLDVFDKLNSFCREGTTAKTEQMLDLESNAVGVTGADKRVYDTSTPEGYFYNALQNDGFSMTELEGVLSTEGNALIVSIAGSGKTTALIFKIMRDIITGSATKVVQHKGCEPIRVLDSIWVSTFLKSGAEELQDRMGYWQNRFGYMDTKNSIQFSTLHAEFKRVVEAMIGQKCKIIDNDTALRLLKRTLNELGISRDGNPLNAEDIQTIQSIISYARNRLDDTRYQHESCEDYGLIPPLLDRLITGYADKRMATGTYDFEDFQEMLYKYCYVNKNENVVQYLRNRYKYIYLDEFQDISQLQYEVLKVYAGGANKVLAIGDDDQAIYSFRGSDVDIILNKFREDFNPTVCKLSYNYRCPSNVLTPISNSIRKNVNRYDKEIKSALQGGKFEAIAFPNMFLMLDKLQKDLTEDTKEGKSVAILCRNNFDGLIPAVALEMVGGYDFNISSTKMTMNSALPKQIINIARVFTDSNTSAVQNTLTLLVPRKEQYKLKDLQMTMKLDNCGLFQIPLEDFKYSLPDLYDVMTTLHEYRARGEEIVGLKYLYEYVKMNSFTSNSAYCTNAKAFIDTVLYMLDVGKYNSVGDFLYNIKTINERLGARVKTMKPKAKISIVTVHEFKGKERDSTYVWNDSISVYPPARCDINNKTAVEEERRVHYIACTRAKEKNTIYTMVGRQGMFLREMLVACKPYNTEIKAELGKENTSTLQEGIKDNITGMLGGAKDV